MIKYIKIQYIRLWEWLCVNYYKPLLYTLGFFVIIILIYIILKNPYILYLLSLSASAFLVFRVLVLKRLLVDLGTTLTVTSIVLALTFFSYNESVVLRPKKEMTVALGIELDMVKSQIDEASKRSDNDSFTRNRFDVRLSWLNIDKIINSLAQQNPECVRSYLIFLKRVEAANVMIDGLIEINTLNKIAYSQKLWDEYSTRLINDSKELQNTLETFKNSGCNLKI